MQQEIELNKLKKEKILQFVKIYGQQDRIIEKLRHFVRDTPRLIQWILSHKIKYN